MPPPGAITPPRVLRRCFHILFKISQNIPLHETIPLSPLLVYDRRMSVNEAMVLLRDVREFHPGAAEFIALEVASGASIAELHEHHEDMVPSPLIVNRWRRQVPAFDLLMNEAEQAKAQTLADQIIKIAGDEDKQAAISNNMIKARQWLSEKLSGASADASGMTFNANIRLTDEQLIMIASGGKPALEGELDDETPIQALVGQDDLPVVDESGGLSVGAGEAGAEAAEALHDDGSGGPGDTAREVGLDDGIKQSRATDEAEASAVPVIEEERAPQAESVDDGWP